MKYNLARHYYFQIGVIICPNTTNTEKKRPHGTAVGIVVVNFFIELGDTYVRG